MVAPELHPTGTILEQAAVIKGRLLEVQADIDAHANARTDLLLGEITHEQGYFAPPNEADPDGLIDSRIHAKTPVIPPGLLARVLPLRPASAQTTLASRGAGANILHGRDDRLLVIAGPCSIHDPEAALEYADNINRWRTLYGAEIELIMRFYTEKPRTELDWKGITYDPLLDGSYDINLGVTATRLLASEITRRGTPLGTERLNAQTPQYISGFVVYDAIGAFNTTDQKAREYGSGTSSLLGFKNTKEGSVEVAAQAVVAANGEHAFLGMGMNGTPHQINTTGNDTAHIILRGSQRGPNYSAVHVARATALLAKKNLLQAIIIDASHGNSDKIAVRQTEVVMDVSEQIALGEMAIKGMMIESNLIAGRQTLEKASIGKLLYGQSITDECAGLDQTEGMLLLLSHAVQRRRELVSAS